MRLFVGVELDQTVRAAAADAAIRIRERLAHARLHVDAQWIPAENLHITIWFIGEAGDELASKVTTALGAQFAVEEFALGIGGAGAFPPSGAPRVFWLGVRTGRDGMARLYDEVRSRFAALGLEPERRTYAPHLTIARVKDVPRGAARAVREALVSDDVDCGAFPVRAVTLFRSRTSPKGATYEALLRVPLS